MSAVIFASSLLLVASPARPAHALSGAASIATSSDTSCLVDTSGAAYCWGRNNIGQRGDGGAGAGSVVPGVVAGGLIFTRISVGIYVTCGIVANGDAYCWGSNDSGQLGGSPNSYEDHPTLVAGGHTFSAISAGLHYVCALELSGTIYCWGSNSDGQLGDGTTSDRSVPTPIAGGGTYVNVSAAQHHSCAVRSSGAAYCWGLNASGQVGDGTTTNRLSPTSVTGGLNFSAIDAGLDHSCAIRTNSAAYCWGNNSLGQLGNGTTSASTSPVAVSGGLTIASVSVGQQMSCAVTTAGSGYCWGANSYGQLGTGNNTDYTSPTAVTGGLAWVEISVSITDGSQATCGVSSGGGAFCWGSGAEGNIGNGFTADRNSPTVVHLIVVSRSATVAGIVDPSLTFTVAGRASACNGQSAAGFQTGSSSTSVALGHLNPTVVGGGAQDLTLATNAANGFAVYIRTSGTTPNVFRTSGGSTVADVTGSHASPSASLAAGAAGFGYTTSDPSIAFGSNKWAALTSTDETVMSASAGTTSKAVCTGFQATVSATTAAGSYSAPVIYTAVPLF